MPARQRPGRLDRAPATRASGPGSGDSVWRVDIGSALGCHQPPMNQYQSRLGRAPLILRGRWGVWGGAGAWDARAERLGGGAGRFLLASGFRVLSRRRPARSNEQASPGPAADGRPGPSTVAGEGERVQVRGPLGARWRGLGWIEALSCTL